MAAITIGSVAHWGRGWTGKLPKGWELIESDEDWAFGKAPDGRLARPCRIAGPSHPGLKPGERYMDTEHGVIDLPAPDSAQL